jgi:hypothetical protein
MNKKQDCIVSLIDLDHTMTRQSPSKLMRKLHQRVSDFAHNLAWHDEVCFWQDSVLLLASVNSTKDSYKRAMNDVKSMKDTVNELRACHAVSVKGRSFRPPNLPCHNKPRTIYLSASSFAFTNCSTIEKELKDWEADWYIDSRIVKKINARRGDFTPRQITLLPARTKPRNIHGYIGSFFLPDQGAA